MKLVPDEPTEEMVDATIQFISKRGVLSHPQVRDWRGTENGDTEAAWEKDYCVALCKAMLAAAPSQPAQPEQAVVDLYLWAAVSPDGKLIAAPFDTEQQVKDWAAMSLDEKYRPYRPVKFYTHPALTPEQPEQVIAWMGRIGDDWRVIHRDEMAKQPSDVQELWKSAQPLYGRPALTDEQIREIAEKLQVHLTGMLVASCNCDTKTPDVEHHEKRCHYRKTSEAVEIIDNLCKAITEALRGRG